MIAESTKGAVAVYTSGKRLPVRLWKANGITADGLVISPFNGHLRRAWDVTEQEPDGEHNYEFERYEFPTRTRFGPGL